jgi:4-hydroxybenzoate polyprenyltransferase
MLQSALVFAKHEILYAGHLQSIGVVGIVLTVASLSGTPMTFFMLLVPYLLLQAIYYYDRYRDLEMDITTNATRTQHLQKYQNIIPLLIAVFLVMAIFFILVFSNIATLIFSVAVIAFGLLYPRVFKQITKTIPLFKNVYVSFVFALFVLFPFVYMSEKILITDIGPLFMFVLAEGIIMQMILDIKDVTSDQKRQIRTLPIMIKEKSTIHFIFVASSVIFTSALLFAYRTYAPAVIPLAAISFIVNVASILLVLQEKPTGYIIVSAKYLFWPLTILLYWL